MADIIPGNYSVVERSDYDDRIYIATDSISELAFPHNAFVESLPSLVSVRFTREQKLATMRLFAKAPLLLEMLEEVMHDEKECYSAKFRNWDERYQDCREAWPGDRQGWCSYCRAADIVEYVRGDE